MLNIRALKTYRRHNAPFTLDIDLEILTGEKRAVFFGPSGSGKTLTMQCIAGLVRPDHGFISLKDDIFFDSSRKYFLPPQKRHIGYMFQDYALFPHLNILRNIAYSSSGLFGVRVSENEKIRARQIMERLGIEKLENHLPAEISGGQRQRAALARALNSRPQLLLLDEPFSALDPLLRERLRVEMKKILENFHIPAVVITHDPEDVDAFAGQLTFFRGGKAWIEPKWREKRAQYPTAAACLRELSQTY